MATLMRFDPVREMTSLRDEMARLFARTADSAVGSTWAPPIDVFDTPAAIVVKAELPGLEADQVEVQIDDNVLSITGERPFTEEVEEGRYHRIERSYGHFSRNLTLPKDVKADEIAATFTNGVLEVTIPKADEVLPRRITVATANGS